MDPQILSLINLIYLISFVVLLVLAIGRIGTRYVSYKREKMSVPLLLKRDFFFLTGLSLPFLGIFLFRAFKIIPQETSWASIWIIVSGGLAILGTLLWVYIEYFKIEKN